MHFKIFFTTLIVSVFFSNCFAQSNKKPGWDESPQIHEIPAEYKSYSSVIIEDNRIIDYEFRPYQGASVKYTNHKIIRVNDDAAIEKYNKVYLPLHGDNSIESLEVRTVSPEGKITNFNKDNLKTLENVDGYRNYKIFAVEGLVRGGEIEYKYTIQRSFFPFGREVFQGVDPVLFASLKLTVPKSAYFLTKAYNGFPDAKPTDDGKKKISRYVEVKNIPSIKEEDYSAYKANLMRLDYKIESFENPVLLDWDIIAKNLSKRFISNKGESKVYYKLLKEIDLEGLEKEEKIIEVEKFIKNGFTIKQGNNPDFSDIKTVLKTRVANEEGLTHLFLMCLKYLDLHPQIVFSCSKYEGNLDHDFAMVNDIQDVLFYFPATKKYLSPDKRYLRYGPAPSYLAGNNGLFISLENSGNSFRYKDYKVKEIKSLDATSNNLGIKALVTFDEDINNPKVQSESYSQGYRAFESRAAYYYAPNEKDKNEFLNNLTVSSLDNFEILDRKVENPNMDDSANPEKLFKINTSYSSRSLVEKAGNDYIFSIGKLIGKQSELYQEEKRESDIVIPYPTNYHHELEFEIPQGYVAKGLESLNIDNKVLDKNENVVMQFVSTFTIDGDKVKVDVKEFYKELKFPKERYEEFRKVINSASDFNKATVLLEKEI